MAQQTAFAKLTRKLAARRGKRKVSNPKALAAYIGRKKLGKKAFQAKAAAGRHQAAAKRKRR